MNKVSLYTTRSDVVSIDFLFFNSSFVLVSTLAGTLTNGVWYSPVLTLDPGDYTVVAKNSNLVFGQEEITWNGTILVSSKQAIASSVRTELTTELAHLISLQNGLTTYQGILLEELFNLMGLDPTKPLVVTRTTRTVGDIEQSIVSTDSSTTVTRTDDNFPP